jgi:site-specific DNA recombinase
VSGFQSRHCRNQILPVEYGNQFLNRFVGIVRSRLKVFLNRKIARLTDAMIDSDAPVSQFTSKIAELDAEKQKIEIQLQDSSKPTTTVALHPAAQERYLAAVQELAQTIRIEGAVGKISEAVRELIDSVIVEKTMPGEPIRLKVNGRPAALIGQPMFPESSLSGAKLVAREGLEPPTPGL